MSTRLLLFQCFLLFVICATVYANSPQIHISGTNENSFPGRIRLVGQARRLDIFPHGVAVGRSISTSSSSSRWPTRNEWTGVKFPTTLAAPAPNYRRYQLTNKTTTPEPSITPVKLRVVLPKRDFIPKANFYEPLKVSDTTPRVNFDQEKKVQPPTTTMASKKTLRRIVVKKYVNPVRGNPRRNETPSTTTTTPATTTTMAARTPTPADFEADDLSESGSFETYADTFAASSNEYYVMSDPFGQESGRSASGVDPHHPAVQQAILSHNDRLQHHVPISTHAHVHRPQKKVRHNQDTTLLPLDKTLVYVGMILSWIFWIVVFTTYYTWGQKFGHPVPGKPGYYKNRPVVLNINQHGNPQFVQRGLDTENSSWDWAQVIYMICLAKDSYSKFDFQSLECQKKALCELSMEKNAENGKELTTTNFSYALKRFLDVIEVFPMPDNISTYLKEYREAIEGRSVYRDCVTTYPDCKFSLQEVFSKYQNLVVKK